jgi:N-acetylmuramoyl-L-alanine amidase
MSPVTVVQRGPSPNRRARKAPSITAIVIHDTGSHSAESAISWLCNTASGVSAHYVIDRDGTIYNVVPDAECAWHAGASELFGVSNVNEFSIGIEVVDADDRAADPYPTVQLDAVVALTSDLVRRYQITLNHIVGHADVAVPHRRKIDPGPDFPWYDFLIRVALGVSK